MADCPYLLQQQSLCRGPISKKNFIANMPVVNDIDELTGLPLFMLAAIGENSDIE